MKRITLILILLIGLSLACSLGGLASSGGNPSLELSSPTPENCCGDDVCAGPENPEKCPQDCAGTLPPTNASAKSALFYISSTFHIETKPTSWPQPDEFLVFLEQTTALGVRWSVGADIGWLEGEPRAAEIIQKSEALGVQWDVHVHDMADRAKAAALISQYGGHPTSVFSGFLIDELESFRQPSTYRGYTWTPGVLWGAVTCPSHRPGCDDNSAGLWSPLSSDQYQVHDPSGTLVHVGGGTHLLADARTLVGTIAAGGYDYPVISFTLMVAPSTLKVANSDDGFEQISAFVGELNAYPFVRWATIEETAQAWLAAGSIPGRIEMP